MIKSIITIAALSLLANCTPDRPKSPPGPSKAEILCNTEGVPDLRAIYTAEGVLIWDAVIELPTKNIAFDRKNPDSSSSWAPHKIFNIGNSEPILLMRFIEAIEDALGKKAKKNFLPMMTLNLTCLQKLQVRAALVFLGFKV